MNRKEMDHPVSSRPCLLLGTSKRVMLLRCVQAAGRGSMKRAIAQHSYQCGMSAQWTIGATRCDDKCENTVWLETRGNCGRVRRCSDDTVTHDTHVQGKCHIPPGKSILLTDWARRMKRAEERSWCVMKDFATTVRHDVFAPTSSPVSVKRLLLYAALYDLRVETGDVACPFTQADTSCEMFTRPLKSQEREGWIWRLHGAIIGIRTALASVPTECMRATTYGLQTRTRPSIAAQWAEIERKFQDQLSKMPQL